jgi:CheY-like chemotaxis protein
MKVPTTDGIDVRALELIVEAGLLSSLVDAYFGSVPLILQQLRRALTQRDMRATAAAAHNARSANGSVGAFRLAELLKNIEQRALANAREAELESMWNDIDTEYQQVASWLLDVSSTGRSGSGRVGTGKQRRVLIVEDNNVNVLVLQQLLSKLNLRSEVAVNGKIALDLLEKAAGKQVYSAVLMDLHMPVMDGIEATRRLRELESERGWRRTPVIAVTGSLSYTDVMWTEAGLDGFVGKPVCASMLMQVLQPFLHR